MSLKVLLPCVCGLCVCLLTGSVLVHASKHCQNDRCTRCDEGYCGKYCEKNCIGHCLGGCAKDTCLCFNCADGFHQSNCSVPCSDKCYSLTGKNPACDRETGNCRSGCVHGHCSSSTKCQKKCGNCKNNFCDMDCYCKGGCIRGFKGNTCEEPEPCDPCPPCQECPQLENKTAEMDQCKCDNATTNNNHPMSHREAFFLDFGYTFVFSVIVGLSLCCCFKVSLQGLKLSFGCVMFNIFVFVVGLFLLGFKLF